MSTPILFGSIRVRPPNFYLDAALTLLEAMTLAQADNDKRCSVQRSLQPQA